MNFEQTIKKFCAKYPHLHDASFTKQLSFVEDQWGHFCTWIREGKHLES